VLVVIKCENKFFCCKSCTLEEGEYCQISSWGQYIMRENIGGGATIGKHGMVESDSAGSLSVMDQKIDRN